jgi:alcohol dehydrogenase class IV
MKEFQCIVPRMLFGSGRRRELGEQAARLGRRAFLALDPFLESSGARGELETLLEGAGVSTVAFSGIEPDPDCFGADRAGSIAREKGCDLVVAVGGGSAIDFGKGVAVVAANPGTAWEYTRRKDHTPRVPGESTLPVIAVPTTAGTGSEMTHFAVFSNSRIREKSTIVSERIFPKLALVDAELTYTCPPRLTALTGVDVLAHSIEAYINVNASPWARLVSLEAIRRVGVFLRRAVADGTDSEARQEMAWASVLAGMAIAHANPTLPHALGQAAGGYLHAPHGASVAACLPEVMRVSAGAAPRVFAEVAAALDPDTARLSEARRAERCTALVEGLFRDIGVTVRLGDFGLKEEDIERVTQIAMTGYFTGISQHPTQVDAEGIKRIYRACL